MRSRWKWIKCFFYILSRRKICCYWWHDICRWSDRVIERQQNIGVPASQPASQSSWLKITLSLADRVSFLEWYGRQLCCYAGVVVLLAQSAGVITPQQETIQEETVEPGEPGEPANNYSLTTHYNSLTISDITYSVNNLTSSHFIICLLPKFK